jgi:hypothetical protein
MAISYANVASRMVIGVSRFLNREASAAKASFTEAVRRKVTRQNGAKIRWE